MPLMLLVTWSLLAAAVPPSTASPAAVATTSDATTQVTDDEEDAAITPAALRAQALTADPRLDDELLAPAMAQSGELPDNSSDLSIDVDRWLLHDVLSEGVAQTASAKAATVATADLEMSHNATDDWQNALRRARASAMLSGQPQHHHALDTHGVAFDIPLASHPLVDLYIDYFTGRGRWFFERWLNRGALVIPMMQEILAAEGVPKDLVYLAMVESGFSAHAYSSAAAVGYWQFIASTGTTYGLSRDRFVDERRDFVRATHGAARFLKALHRHLGDWHLAWASYNAGEGRIRRAMNKTGAKTFWQLIAQPNGLAKETVHYVPKIIAAAIVAKDAARYGFTVAPPQLLRFDTVAVRGALELAVLAKEANCSLTSLRELNPSLLYDVTPPQRTSQLRVPKGAQAAVTAALGRLPPQKRLTYAAYLVRRGDTLSSIARRMHSNVDTLRQFNRTAAGPLRPGSELLVPSFRLNNAPVAPARAKPAPMRLARLMGARSKKPMVSLVSRAPAARSGRKNKARARHVVSSGDTLWSIARRYGVALEDLKGRSKKRGSRIAVGEVIDIF